MCQFRTKFNFQRTILITLIEFLLSHLYMYYKIPVSLLQLPFLYRLVVVLLYA